MRRLTFSIHLSICLSVYTHVHFRAHTCVLVRFYAGLVGLSIHLDIHLHIHLFFCKILLESIEVRQFSLPTCSIELSISVSLCLPIYPLHLFVSRHICPCILLSSHLSAFIFHARSHVGVHVHTHTWIYTHKYRRDIEDIRYLLRGVGKLHARTRSSRDAIIVSGCRRGDPVN